MKFNINHSVLYFPFVDAKNERRKKRKKTYLIYLFVLFHTCMVHSCLFVCINLRTLVYTRAERSTEMLMMSIFIENNRQT